MIKQGLQMAAKTWNRKYKTKAEDRSFEYNYQNEGSDKSILSGS